MEWDPGERVCLSIVLDKPSALEAGYATMGISTNQKAMDYRAQLLSTQKRMEKTISTQVSFTDAVPGAYYYPAVAWALEQGVTTGMNDGTFGVQATCNRAQVVTFLYRAVAK